MVTVDKCRSHAYVDRSVDERRRADETDDGIQRARCRHVVWLDPLDPVVDDIGEPDTLFASLPC